jgi:hypothetical protein
LNGRFSRIAFPRLSRRAHSGAMISATGSRFGKDDPRLENDRRSFGALRSRRLGNYPREWRRCVPNGALPRELQVTHISASLEPIQVPIIPVFAPPIRDFSTSHFSHFVSQHTARTTSRMRMAAPGASCTAPATRGRRSPTGHTYAVGDACACVSH